MLLILCKGYSLVRFRHQIWPVLTTNVSNTAAWLIASLASLPHLISEKSPSWQRSGWSDELYTGFRVPFVTKSQGWFVFKLSYIVNFPYVDDITSRNVSDEFISLKLCDSNNIIYHCFF